MKLVHTLLSVIPFIFIILIGITLLPETLLSSIFWMLLAGIVLHGVMSFATKPTVGDDWSERNGIRRTLWFFYAVGLALVAFLLSAKAFGFSVPELRTFQNKYEYYALCSIIAAICNIIRAGMRMFARPTLT